MIHKPNFSSFTETAAQILQGGDSKIIERLGKVIQETSQKIQALQRTLSEKDQTIDSLVKNLELITTQYQILKPIAENRLEQMQQLEVRISALIEELRFVRVENRELLVEKDRLCETILQDGSHLADVRQQLAEMQMEEENRAERAAQIRVDEMRRRDANERYLEQLVGRLHRIRNGNAYKILKINFSPDVPLVGIFSQNRTIRKIKQYCLKALYWPFSAPDVELMGREVERIRREMRQVARVLGRSLNEEIFADFLYLFDRLRPHST